ncbi:MAG: flavohemoglobin expression-modulating QEGLA motif protein [Myxococcales bacterium]|nr:flavohemoglobin expression-modulating QEGLA motif protein [Myxococcales bacterium]
MAERSSSGEKERGRGSKDSGDAAAPEKGERKGNGRAASAASAASDAPDGDAKGASKTTPPARDSASLLDDANRTPSIPPMPAAGPWRSYKEIVAQVATQIVDAQRPIRVLQALRWDNAVEEQFRKSRFKELPKVDAETYAAAELGFDVKAKAAEFEDIAREIDASLGESDAIGNILMQTAIEYRDICRMLEARGTPTFYAYSRKLYGSPKDKFPDGKLALRDLGHLLYEIFTNIDDAALGPTHERNIPADEAAAELNARFEKYFSDNTVHVEVDDAILADAAAGSDYVKVRSGAHFSQRDIDVLEVHEGWVHVATSLNGQQQTVAKWLSKGPPRTTTVQEGLAALLEIFTFRTFPRRARRLNDRVLAVDKAEDGASFIDVFEWFRTEGYDEDECFNNTRRIFRGGVVEGGAPFTKDACYCKGIVLNYAFIRSAIEHNHVDLIPFLFVGKVAHEDVPVLARRVNDGVVKAPKYVPPMFRDLNGLAIWMAYSAFFARLGGEAISEHYAKIFARAG